MPPSLINPYFPPFQPASQVTIVPRFSRQMERLRPGARLMRGAFTVYDYQDCAWRNAHARPNGHIKDGDKLSGAVPGGGIRASPERVAGAGAGFPAKAAPR